MNDKTSKKKKKEEKGKKLKWRTIQIKVPVCPKCGSNMEPQISGDIFTLWTHKCTNPACDYKTRL